MAIARLEKPHCGNNAVPFMNRTISSPLTISAMHSAESLTYDLQSQVGCLDDLAPRLDLLVAQRFHDVRLIALDARCGKVAEHLANDVMLAGFFEVRADDIAGVRVGL